MPVVTMMKANETFDSTENDQGADAPDPTEIESAKETAPPTRSKKVTYAIIGGSLLAVVAIIVGVVVATTGGGGETVSSTVDSDNMMSCNMSQMETMGLSLFSMSPAEMNMTDDMMTMDSMMLDCVAEGQEPAVYMKMSSEQVTMDSGATQTIWNGAMMGGPIGFATVIQNMDGTMAGTFTTEEASYSMMTDPNGDMQMKMTLWADFPNGSAANETNNTGATDSGLVAESSGPPMGMSGTRVIDKVRSVITGLTGGRRLGHTRKLQDNTVRILLIVTNAAMCEYAGSQAGCDFSSNRGAFDSRVPLLQAEMNNAMQGVQVPSAVQIVDVVYLSEGFRGGADVETLDIIRFDENIAQWRSDAQADLVAMITGSGGSYCGIAYLDSPESSSRVDCLDSYTFSHELGHNYGGRHDRASTQTGMHPYGHGYTDPSGRLRTVMSYNCPGGCPVIPYFSADGFTVSDIPIGTPTENNARLLSENAARTADFF